VRVSSLIGAGIGFLIGSISASFLYGLLPGDITGSLSEENFKLLAEIIGAYLGYKEF